MLINASEQTEDCEVTRQMRKKRAKKEWQGQYGISKEATVIVGDTEQTKNNTEEGSARPKRRGYVETALGGRSHKNEGVDGAFLQRTWGLFRKK